MTPKGPRWTGKVVLVPEKLEEPLRWKKPRRIFVNSMSDLFHESLTDTQIQNVFSVMESARHHIYQVLTKRPQRMLDFVTKFDDWLKYASDYPGHLSFEKRFPHVWLGVSCEDQKTADERIPLLLETPAAVRWISAEPLLGPIDLSAFTGVTPNITGEREQRYSEVDWVVLGGESGPKSRPMNLVWARSMVAKCKAAGVPVFVKQLGANPVIDRDQWQNLPARYILRLSDKKGGDINEWPSDLRVREFPTAA
jgi:protein gp37